MRGDRRPIPDEFVPKGVRRIGGREVDQIEDPVDIIESHCPECGADVISGAVEVDTGVMYKQECARCDWEWGQMRDDTRPTPGDDEVSS